VRATIAYGECTGCGPAAVVACDSVFMRDRQAAAIGIEIFDRCVRSQESVEVGRTLAAFLGDRVARPSASQSWGLSVAASEGLSIRD